MMMTYTLTAYEKTGEKLLEETFQAASEAEAKEIGTVKLTEKQLLHVTHRCTSALGKLVLFHP